MQSDKVVATSNAQYDNGVQAVNDFATGKVAMILSQNNADASIVSNGMKNDQYGVVPFPAPADGKKIASFVAGINLSIFKNTKNKDAALKFVKYMTSEDIQTKLGKPYASLPVLNGAKPTFTDNAEEAATFQKIYNDMTKPLPLVPAEDQFENTVGKAMNDMFAKIATGGTVSDSDIKTALTERAGPGQAVDRRLTRLIRLPGGASGPQRCVPASRPADTATPQGDPCRRRQTSAAPSARPSPS